MQWTLVEEALQRDMEAPKKVGAPLRMDSNDGDHRVPDMGRSIKVPAGQTPATGAVSASEMPNQATIQTTSHTTSHTGKRGSSSVADKEQKKLKRLLRNRVSAQQARERKKAYVGDLEGRSKDLEQRNAELEEKVATLQRENCMLRQILKNTALKKTPGGSSDQPVMHQ